MSDMSQIPVKSWHPLPRVQKFTLHTLWVALRCWWYIALPLGILLAAGVASWLWMNHVDRWTSSASLHIKDKQDVILRDSQLESQRFIENQLAIIRSRRILGPLVSIPEIGSAPEVAGSNDPVTVIARGLRIRREAQSEIYHLSYTGLSPEKSKLIIDSVVKAYLDFNRKLEAEQDNRIIALLDEQRMARYEEMNQLRENVRTLSIQLTGIDPFQVETDDDRNRQQERLDGLRAHVYNLQINQDTLAEQIRREEEAQSEEKVELSQVEVDVQLRSQPGYVTLQAKIDALQRKEGDYAKTTKKDDGNQSLKQLRSELAAASEALEKYKRDARAEIEETMKKQLLANRAEKLGIMRNSYVNGDARLKVAKERLATEEKSKSEEKKPPGYSLELEARKDRLEQVTKMHNDLQARILSIKTEQKAPDRVKMWQEPEVPKSPDNHNFWVVLVGATLSVLCLPTGLCVLWEHLFRRVNNRQDIEENQQIPVIGEVTALPTRKRKTPLKERGSERDYTLFEESVESVRTCLSLMSTLRDMHSLAVMSAVSGEGKTSLAAQLAVCIARSHDKRTLLIDGDMRAPDMHGIFQLDSTPGLAEVLGSECRVGDAIEVGVTGNLDVMVAGRLKCSPHQLLNANEFSTLLTKLKKHYRYIVIDTPPILPASESLVMARAADAAVLCMRRDHSRVDQSQDAYGRMLAAGVKVAGAVLNGIPTRQYYYRYGNYSYRLAGGKSSGKRDPSKEEVRPKDSGSSSRSKGTETRSPGGSTPPANGSSSTALPATRTNVGADATLT